MMTLDEAVASIKSYAYLFDWNIEDNRQRIITTMVLITGDIYGVTTSKIWAMLADIGVQRNDL